MVELASVQVHDLKETKCPDIETIRLLARTSSTKMPSGIAGPRSQSPALHPQIEGLLKHCSACSGLKDALASLQVRCSKQMLTENAMCRCLFTSSH